MLITGGIIIDKVQLTTNHEQQIPRDYFFMNHLLFNSLTDPVPGIRGDLDIIPVSHEGHELLYFHDMLGYATENFILDRSVAPIMTQFSGGQTINDILDMFPAPDVSGVGKTELLDFVRFLDQNRILYSSYFQNISGQVEADFEAAQTRPPISNGSSYPDDPGELRLLFDRAFAQANHTSSAAEAGAIRALYAPHIDPRVGMESYVKAFAPLKSLKPRRVVLLATSHYAGLYGSLYLGRPFILTKKHFETPLGLVKTDRESIERLSDLNNPGLSFSDRAHRVEHSIELHLIFLKYLWSHDFTLVPVLVGSLDDLLYLEDGDLGNKMRSFGESLHQLFAGDPDTLFLISGDLAHFGRKFGDDQPAAAYFDEVHQFDRQFMEAAVQGSPETVLRVMQTNNDRYRICGFPPLISFLTAMPNLTGEQICYDLWDEQERESAVTFGSILYRQAK